MTKTRHFIGLTALAASILALALAGAAVDMQDAMARCKARGLSFDACHANLYR